MFIYLYLIVIQYLFFINMIRTFESKGKKALVYNCFKEIENLYKPELHQEMMKIIKEKINFFKNNTFHIDTKSLKPEYQYLSVLSKLLPPEYYSQFILEKNIFKNLISTRIHVHKNQLLSFKSCLNLETISQKMFLEKVVSADLIFRTGVLFEWIEKTSKMDKIDISINPESGIPSIYAIDYISPGENIFTIPQLKVITIDKIEDEYNLIKNVKTILFREHERNILDILIFIRDIIFFPKKDKPSFEQYTLNFPRNMSNFPVLYEKEELQLLSNSYLMKKIENKKAHIKRFYEAICYLQPNSCDKVNYEIFQKLYTFTRRKIFTEIFNYEEFFTIIPFLDWMKHSSLNPSAYFKRGNNFEINLISNKEITPGEEITINFSLKPMKHSIELVNYGSCCEGNLSEKEKISLEFLLEVDIDNYNEKEDIIKKIKGNENNLSLIIDSNFESDILKGVFNLIRFASVKENWTNFKDYIIKLYKSSLKENDNGENLNDFRIFWMSFHNKIELEINFLNKLKNILERNYNKFDKTLEEDIEFFNNNKEFLTSNLKNIYSYRISMKSLYKFYFSFCDQMINLLKMSPSQFNEHISNNPTFYLRHKDYLDFLKRFFE